MTKNDTVSEVARAVERLGYDLSAEDLSKVYEEFSHTAEKKNITSRELDAIVASVAMQCPPTYVLCSYVTNSGNVIKASATVELLSATAKSFRSLRRRRTDRRGVHGDRTGRRASLRA